MKTEFERKVEQSARHIDDLIATLDDTTLDLHIAIMDTNDDLLELNEEKTKKGMP